MISLSFLVMINVQHLLWLVTQITMDTHDTAKMGTVAFWQLYLYLSNLWAIYHRFTHTHATPYPCEPFCTPRLSSALSSLPRGPTTLAIIWC